MDQRTEQAAVANEIRRGICGEEGSIKVSSNNRLKNAIKRYMRKITQEPSLIPVLW